MIKAIKQEVVEKGESEVLTKLSRGRFGKPKKSEDDDILFEINGLVIRANSSYEIVGRMDVSAAAPLRERGTSKLPQSGIMEVKTLSFDTGTGTYDTGFFEGSACYRGWDAEEVKKQVELRTKYIRKPYEAIKGVGVLEQTNYDFWDNYMPVEYEGRTLFTNDITQLFELYVLIQSRKILPKHLEGSPDFPNARYCIMDKKHVLNVQHKRNNERVQALSKFSVLLENDLTKLQYVLRWIEFDFTDGVSEHQLTSDFFNYIDDRDAYDRAERFIMTASRAEKEMYYNQYKLYYYLDYLMQRGQIRKTDVGYYLETFELGLDLRAASERLNENADMLDAKFRVITLAETLGVGRAKTDVE
jgi:hypothetical protein